MDAFPKSIVPAEVEEVTEEERYLSSIVRL